MICIPKNDLVLRTEVVFVFDLLGINFENMVYTDSEIFENQKDFHWNLHLVDHNFYDKSILNLNSYEILSVIDHHVDEHGPCKELKKIEMVGSCATLIASLFKEKFCCANQDFSLTKDLRVLLSAAILIDTINLDFQKGRTTIKDVEMLKFLAIDKDFMNYDDFYKKLILAKIDISKLSVHDLLRRDSKSFECSIGSVFICSVTGITWKEFSARKCVSEDIATYSSKNNISIFILMLASHHDDGTFQRFLAIDPGKSMMSDCINDMIDRLELVKITTDGFDNWVVYEQLNVRSSRKIVLPLVKSWFTE